VYILQSRNLAAATEKERGLNGKWFGLAGKDIEWALQYFGFINPLAIRVIPHHIRFRIANGDQEYKVFSIIHPDP
jgi:hypothetical protein